MSAESRTATPSSYVLRRVARGAVSVDGPDSDEVRQFDSTAPEGRTRVRLTFDGQH